MWTFYEVGGAVRDSLLGLESKDIDYVAVADETAILNLYEYPDCNYLFNRLVNYLKNEGYEVFLETPDCYTVRARFPRNHVNSGMVADFVLARKEVGYLPGTRAPIVVPGTLLDDLRRRDFTINAMARGLNGEIIDPFNGQRDLQDRILRTPISGEITFEDDPLRLFRAIRFAITKKMVISDDIRAIIRSFDYEERMVVVSEERIREELVKCFKANTELTLTYLEYYSQLKKYIFNNTTIWLKPTTEQ